MVNQNFDKFNKVQQNHRSQYLGGSQDAKSTDKSLDDGKDHNGVSVGAEGRSFTSKRK